MNAESVNRRSSASAQSGSVPDPQLPSAVQPRGAESGEEISDRVFHLLIEQPQSMNVFRVEDGGSQASIGMCSA